MTGSTFEEEKVFFVDPAAVRFGRGIGRFLHLNLSNLNDYINNSLFKF